MISIARSSIVQLGKTHCPAAARHAELGTPRDAAPMAVGVGVHHCIEAVATRGDDESPQEAIDRATAGLVADGRQFEGGPVEYLRVEDADSARDLTLDFLDRDLIPEGEEWMRAELSVDLDSHWHVVERGACRCGCDGLTHELGGGRCRGIVCGSPVERCPCKRFEPAAIWRQALDMVWLSHEEGEDGETLTVANAMDFKGWNVHNWETSLQGKGAAVCLVALFPKADIVRRRVASYQPRGRTWSVDLDTRDFEDADTIEEYRQSIAVASAGMRRRQDRTPNELAQPGAGCSAGFAGCPYLAQCQPALDLAATSAASWIARPVGGGTVKDAALAWTLAEAIKQESAKAVKAALFGTAGVETPDGVSVVGWKKTGGSEIHPNAASILAREWAETARNLDPGSPEAIEMSATIDGLLSVKGALGVTTVKAIVSRLEDILGEDEAEALLARCLADKPGRKLATWKLPERDYDNDSDLLMADLKGSLKSCN